MKNKSIFCGILSFFILVGVVGCNENPEMEPCEPATVEAFSVPEDSLCLGHWQWIYTIKRSWNYFQEEWVVVDTVYPGDIEPGFETLDYAHCTIGLSEMCFNKSGTVASGCYRLRNSLLSPAYDGPSDSVVSTAFFDWDADYGIQISAYLPEAQGDTTFAEVYGLWMFYVEDEEGDGVRYRNRFVKVE